MGYLRFSEERLSWKSSHQSIASAANRSLSEVGISLSFLQAPFGHSSVAPPPVQNISAGLPTLHSRQVSEHSSPEVLNICGGGRIMESCRLRDPVGLWLGCRRPTILNAPTVRASTQRIHKHKPTYRYQSNVVACARLTVASATVYDRLTLAMMTATAS